jgi:hypothetical protein
VVVAVADGEVPGVAEAGGVVAKGDGEGAAGELVTVGEPGGVDDAEGVAVGELGGAIVGVDVGTSVGVLVAVGVGVSVGQGPPHARAGTAYKARARTAAGRAARYDVRCRFKRLFLSWAGSRRPPGLVLLAAGAFTAARNLLS